MALSSATISARNRTSAPRLQRRTDRNVGRLSRGGFYLAESGSDLLQVRNHRDVVVFEPSHFALLIHDSDGAAGNSFVREVHAVFLAHRALRMKIGQQ